MYPHTYTNKKSSIVLQHMWVKLKLSFLNSLMSGKCQELPSQTLTSLLHGDTSSPEAPCVLTPHTTICHACASRLVVGAPLEVVAVNQTGRLYDCAAATGLCQPISLHSE